MDGVYQGEGKLHQDFNFCVPFAENLRKIGPEHGCEGLVVNTRAEKTPRSTTSTDIEHGTTLLEFALIRTIARGTSRVQAVRRETQATFLDQDTLHILTESGVGSPAVTCEGNMEVRDIQ